MEGDIPIVAGTRNFNVNQTTPDSSDNPKKTYTTTRKGAINRGIIVACCIAAVIYITLWFMSINITNFYCWTRNDYYCASVEIVHTIFVIGLCAAIIIPSIVGIYYGLTAAKNAEYLDLARGITLSRRQIDNYTADLIHVLKLSAQSEATTGIDTYSPTYTGVKPVKPVIKDDLALGLELIEGDAHDTLE